jgi:hypothetical protein
MSNVMKLEPLMDQTLQVLFGQLDSRFVGSERTFDLSKWLQFFAFEVMGTISFSKRYGFLEDGRDVNGLLGGIWGFMKSAAPVRLLLDLRLWSRKKRPLTSIPDGPDALVR